MNKGNFEIGQSVLLNGKTYTIAGTIKRSFLLERGGKQYKATAKMMEKIQVQNKAGIGTGRRKRTKRSATYHMENRLKFKQIFNKHFKMPETRDECFAWLSELSNCLSPENLHCDGEISRSAAMRKASALRAEWKEVEYILGYRVDEGEVWNWERAEWERKRA